MSVNTAINLTASLFMLTPTPHDIKELVNGFTNGLVTKAGLSTFAECHDEATGVDELVKNARTDFKIHDAAHIEAGFKELNLAFMMVPEVFGVCENCKSDI